MPSLILALPLFVTFLQAPATAPLPPADATARARSVLAALGAGEFAKVTGQFDDAMKAAVPLDRLTAMWTTLTSQAGSLKACSDQRVRGVSDKQMVISACQFERATFDIQLAFDPAARISGLVFRPAAARSVPYTPAPYADPSTYAEADVTVGSGQWALPGTVTVPSGAGPFPAVVLVHGSGPNDRDETVGPNKPFADLAVGLASRGVAVLRYDKRSRVHPGRMAGSSLTVKEEVIDDAGEAVRVLASRPGIDPAKVFVAGHSLGGMLIPRIAIANPSLAGAIVLAGPARPIEDAIVEQVRYIAMSDGTIAPDEQAQIDQAAQTAAAVKALTAADAKDSATRLVNAPPSYWLDLRGYDPPATAKPLKVPLLVLQGERDFQVTMDDFARWKAALTGKTSVTFRSYPALNHLFMPGTGKSLPAEYTVPSRVAEEVVRDIAAWIKR